MVGLDKSRWYFTKDKLANTPSRKCGITSEKEAYCRYQAAKLIQEMGQRLQVSQLVITTAIMYIHRFYMCHSFSKFQRHNIAPAALFLAAKVEEQPRKLENVITVAHVILEHTSLDSSSQLYSEKVQQMMYNENIILQTLGFDLAVDHPHTIIVTYSQEIRARPPCKDEFGHQAPFDSECTHKAWLLANNSLYMTTLWLQYPPPIVACVCIYLVCKWNNFEAQQVVDSLHRIDKSVTVEYLERLVVEFYAAFERYPSFLKKLMTNSGASGNSNHREDNNISARWNDSTLTNGVVKPVINGHDVVDKSSPAKEKVERVNTPKTVLTPKEYLEKREKERHEKEKAEQREKNNHHHHGHHSHHHLHHHHRNSTSSANDCDSASAIEYHSMSQTASCSSPLRSLATLTQNLSQGSSVQTSTVSDYSSIHTINLSQDSLAPTSGLLQNLSHTSHLSQNSSSQTLNLSQNSSSQILSLSQNSSSEMLSLSQNSSSQILSLSQNSSSQILSLSQNSSVHTPILEQNSSICTSNVTENSSICTSSLSQNSLVGSKPPVAQHLRHGGKFHDHRSAVKAAHSSQLPVRDEMANYRKECSQSEERDSGLRSQSEQRDLGLLTHSEERVLGLPKQIVNNRTLSTSHTHSGENILDSHGHNMQNVSDVPQSETRILDSCSQSVPASHSLVQMPKICDKKKLSKSRSNHIAHKEMESKSQAKVQNDLNNQRQVQSKSENVKYKRELQEVIRNEGELSEVRKYETNKESLQMIAHKYGTKDAVKLPIEVNDTVEALQNKKLANGSAHKKFVKVMKRDLKSKKNMEIGHLQIGLKKFIKTDIKHESISKVVVKKEKVRHKSDLQEVKEKTDHEIDVRDLLQPSIKCENEFKHILPLEDIKPKSTFLFKTDFSLNDVMHPSEKPPDDIFESEIDTKPCDMTPSIDSTPNYPSVCLSQFRVSSSPVLHSPNSPNNANSLAYTARCAVTSTDLSENAHASEANDTLQQLLQPSVTSPDIHLSNKKLPETATSAGPLSGSGRSHTKEVLLDRLMKSATPVANAPQQSQLSSCSDDMLSQQILPNSKSNTKQIQSCTGFKSKQQVEQNTRPTLPIVQMHSELKLKGNNLYAESGLKHIRSQTKVQSRLLQPCTKSESKHNPPSPDSCLKDNTHSHSSGSEEMKPYNKLKSKTKFAESSLKDHIQCNESSLGLKERRAQIVSLSKKNKPRRKSGVRKTRPISELSSEETRPVVESVTQAIHPGTESGTQEIISDYEPSSTGTKVNSQKTGFGVDAGRNLSVDGHISVSHTESQLPKPHFVKDNVAEVEVGLAGSLKPRSKQTGEQIPQKLNSEASFKRIMMVQKLSDRGFELKAKFLLTGNCDLRSVTSTNPECETRTYVSNDISPSLKKDERRHQKHKKERHKHKEKKVKRSDKESKKPKKDKKKKKHRDKDRSKPEKSSRKSSSDGCEEIYTSAIVSSFDTHSRDVGSGLYVDTPGRIKLKLIKPSGNPQGISALYHEGSKLEEDGHTTYDLKGSRDKKKKSNKRKRERSSNEESDRDHSVKRARKSSHKPDCSKQSSHRNASKCSEISVHLPFFL